MSTELTDNAVPEWYQETDTTWGRLLDERCQAFSDREFLSFNGERLTYGQFHQRVTLIARALIKLGVKPGDAVGLWMTNCPEWMLVQYAVYKVGAVLLPLYTYYKKVEVEYVLRQAGPTTLFMMDQFIGKVPAFEILRELVPEIDQCDKESFSSPRFPELRHIVGLGGESVRGRWSWEEIEAMGATSPELDGELEQRCQLVSPLDPMNIMYTSGTTGFPKAGISMHRNNLAAMWHFARKARINESTVILGHMPLFSNFGGLYCSGLALFIGGRLVLTERFDAGESLVLIEQERVTYIPGSPSIFVMLMEHPEYLKRDHSSARGGHVAGAYLPPELMERILHDFGADEMVQAWGMSECAGISTLTGIDDPLEKRLHTVGRPVPSCLLRTVDPSTGQETSREPGEIWLGDVLPGSCLGKGYWRMPEESAAVLTPDGFWHTGDLGSFDDDGYLTFIGRVKEMFTVGGFNVYPAEIELFMGSHKQVAEVHVISIPDRRLGEVPMAWVRVKEGGSVTESELIAHVKENLSSQKVPRYIRFFQPEELPMTGSGKVQKVKLREISCLEMGLQEG